MFEIGDVAQLRVEDAHQLDNGFGRFLALGIAVLFGIEATVNMGVVTGLLPTKGLALPFISYGGSSLVISLFAVGILLNISSGLKIEPIKLKEKK